MFLQVWPSGSSHEEAHLERGQHQPSNAAKGKVVRGKKKKHETNAVSRPVSWLNCPRAEWRGCVPAKACRFAPYWNPVPAGPLFGERRSEGCLLQREYKIMDGEEVFLIEMDLHTKKKTKKKDKRQTKRVNDLYVWCMMFWGHLPDSRYTGTLQNCLRWACVHCECLRLANWPPEEGENKTFWGRRDGLVDGAGLVPMLLWTEWVFWGKCSTCVFPPVAVWRWCRMEVPACLEEGGGPLKPSRLCVWWEREGGCFFWSVTQGPKLPPPPPGHCMTGAFFFFGVFGAATKCAMCYVAWFIILFTSYKAHL